MKYELDQGAGGGHRFGMIVLSTDETLEYETAQVVAGRQANLLHARIPSHEDVTPETLKLMAGSMTQCAAQLPEGLDAVAYGCTSGAVVIGPQEVARLVQVAHPGVPVTNPISAVSAALKSLDVQRIALVTPYVAEVVAPMCDYLAGQGVETVSEVSFGEKEDRTIARIAQRSTRAAMLEAGRADGVQAVFSSCTNLRSFDVIAEVEAELGLPVISSNLALIWHLLWLGKLDPRGWFKTRLFGTELRA